MLRVLVIGYGNPGRLDDGLGPAVADQLVMMAIPGVSVEADYQLTVEDAAAIAEHDAVVFVDAAVHGPEPFAFECVDVDTLPVLGFSSHSIEPPALMALARQLFGSHAAGYTLAIRGYEFDDFGERICERAQANLRAALAYIAPVLRERSMSRVARQRALSRTLPS